MLPDKERSNDQSGQRPTVCPVEELANAYKPSSPIMTSNTAKERSRKVFLKRKTKSVGARCGRRKDVVVTVPSAGMVETESV